MPSARESCANSKLVAPSISELHKRLHDARSRLLDTCDTSSVFTAQPSFLSSPVTSIKMSHELTQTPAKQALSPSGGRRLPFGARYSCCAIGGCIPCFLNTPMSSIIKSGLLLWTHKGHNDILRGFNPPCSLLVMAWVDSEIEVDITSGQAPQNGLRRSPHPRERYQRNILP